MAWTIPEYRRNQVDKAGEILKALTAEATPEDLPQAYTIVNNWRLAHHFPLNTFQTTLRNKSKGVYKEALVAQRIKRLPSIVQKLRDHPTMELSQMQDIGGCRAVVGTVRTVDELVSLYKKSDLKHKQIEEYDYIRSPKKSGYRSFHLVYGYYSDKTETYNGLRIEIQFRSKLQHLWATAVEVVGTFTKQALKSSKGPAEWLRFFSLMGSEIAFRERSVLVPNTPRNKGELKSELRKHCETLDFENKLVAYTAAFQLPQEIKDPYAHYFLLYMNFEKETINVWTFRKNQLNDANEEYLAKEKEAALGKADVVLVSVDSFAKLRRAYPNYFLDTRAFFDLVKESLV